MYPRIPHREAIFFSANEDCISANHMARILIWRRISLTSRKHLQYVYAHVLVKLRAIWLAEILGDGNPFAEKKIATGIMIADRLYVRVYSLCYQGTFCTNCTRVRFSQNNNEGFQGILLTENMYTVCLTVMIFDEERSINTLFISISNVTNVIETFINTASNVLIRSIKLNYIQIWIKIIRIQFCFYKIYIYLRIEDHA